MDSDIKNPSKCMNKVVIDNVSPKEAVGVDGEEDEESNSLLSPQGGVSKRLKNSRRKVQWNDKNGNKLVEILEFQPSDTSDSDDDEDTDSCICTIL